MLGKVDIFLAYLCKDSTDVRNNFIFGMRPQKAKTESKKTKNWNKKREVRQYKIKIPA